MTKKLKLGLIALLIVIALFISVLFLKDHNLAILNPKGTIAEEQRNLIFITVILSVIIVLPVFLLTFTIAWRYREGNSKAKYSPDWAHSRKLETIWWAVPMCLILILSVITWKTSHSLDPFKPIESTQQPLRIQVIALQWKWLFIYPEENVASVNYVHLPVDRPVEFVITADAPMNSFWIPQLGGQVYAMSGMSTKLHLQANEIGKYDGSSANLSGDGFAGMKFSAGVTSAEDYQKWISDTKSTDKSLGMDQYNSLAAPSKNEPVTVYKSVDNGIYDKVIMKYMMPAGSASHEGQMSNSHNM